MGGTLILGTARSDSPSAETHVPSRSMLALPLSAIVLSLIGALVQRALAAALGVPARIVFGIGPRLGPKDREPGPIEIRPIPLWVSTHLERGASTPRELLTRASGPLAIALVPFLVLVLAISARGVDVPRAPGSHDITPMERRDVGVIEATSVAASAIARMVGGFVGVTTPRASGPTPGPVAIVASMPDGPMDGATTLALLAIPWTVVGLFWALVAAIGQLVAAVRARRSAPHSASS